MKSAREGREAAGGPDNAGLDRRAADADPQRGADPAPAEMDVDAMGAIGASSVNWRGLMRKVRSWERK